VGEYRTRDPVDRYRVTRRGEVRQGHLTTFADSTERVKQQAYHYNQRNASATAGNL